jgi:predicted metal-dependent phosphotriesterase family hydrolase
VREPKERMVKGKRNVEEARRDEYGRETEKMREMSRDDEGG